MTDWLHGAKAVAAYAGISMRTFWRYVNKRGFPVRRCLGQIISRKIWVEKWKKRSRAVDPRCEMRIRVRNAMRRIRARGRNKKAAQVGGFN